MNAPVYRKPEKNKRPRSEEAMDDDGTQAEGLEVEDDDEDDDEPMDVTEEARDEKLMAFLDDPVKSMQIFLSSYMREKGLIW